MIGDWGSLELMALVSATAISFVGSLQVGLVNSKVFGFAIQGNKQMAFWASVGGSIPEFLYCFLALFFVKQSMDILLTYKTLIQVVTAVLLLGFGAFLWFTAKRQNSNFDKVQETKSKIPPFVQGFSLAVVNPQLLVFWSAVGAQYTSMHGHFSNETVVAFCLGAFLGAFILLIGVTFFANVLRNRIKPMHYFWAMRVIGLVIGLCGLYLGLTTFLSL